MEVWFQDELEVNKMNESKKRSLIKLSSYMVVLALVGFLVTIWISGLGLTAKIALTSTWVAIIGYALYSGTK